MQLKYLLSLGFSTSVGNLPGAVIPPTPTLEMYTLLIVPTVGAVFKDATLREKRVETTVGGVLIHD